MRPDSKPAVERNEGSLKSSQKSFVTLASSILRLLLEGFTTNAFTGAFGSNPQALQVTQVMTNGPCQAIKVGFGRLSLSHPKKTIESEGRKQIRPHRAVSWPPLYHFFRESMLVADVAQRVVQFLWSRSCPSI